MPLSKSGSQAKEGRSWTRCCGAGTRSPRPEITHGRDYRGEARGYRQLALHRTPLSEEHFAGLSRSLSEKVSEHVINAADRWNTEGSNIRSFKASGAAFGNGPRPWKA